MRFKATVALSEAKNLLLVCATAGPVFAQDPTARVPFATFNPGACYFAQRWIDHAVSWGKPNDAAYTPAGDTTSRLVRDSMPVCAGTFGGRTEDDAQFLNMARMEYQASHDADARANAQRYLRSAGTAGEKRAWALFLIASDAFEARPARLTDARVALAELDKLPPAGPADRAVVARARVSAHYAALLAARRAHDDKAAATEARMVIKEWRTLPPPIGLLEAMPLVQSFLIAAEIEQRAGRIPAVKAIIDSGDKTVPRNAGIARARMTAYVKLAPLLGAKAAPIEAAFWYPATGRAAASVTGRVRVLSFVTHQCSVCAGHYAGLRRFHARMGDRIDFVSVTKTLGYFSDTAPVTAEAEARIDSAYFLGKQRLPGALGVVRSEFGFIPDGRRVDYPNTQDRNYPGARLVIIDKRGVVRHVTALVHAWDPIVEELLAEFVERLIAEP